MTERVPKIGDEVIIHATLCEWNKVQGKIVGISHTPDNDMPYMVQRSDYFEWPFALCELELLTLEDESYPQMAFVRGEK